MFQSTHPRRVRPSAVEAKLMEISFNPRTHVGCDGVAFGSSYNTTKFQSTHPRRVRQHIQQMSEYHSTKLPILRKLSKQNN